MVELLKTNLGWYTLWMIFIIILAYPSIIFVIEKPIKEN
jgi:hypothetical protein